MRDALKGSNLADIRRRSEELNEALQKLGSRIYQQPGGGGTPPPGGGPQQGGDEDKGNTVEGEFREV